MYTVINYITAFWSMVIVPCVTVPINWQYCVKIDEWLIPEIVYGWNIKSGKIHPYQQEKDYLKKIKME